MYGQESWFTLSVFIQMSTAALCGGQAVIIATIYGIATSRCPALMKRSVTRALADEVAFIPTFEQLEPRCHLTNSYYVQKNKKRKIASEPSCRCSIKYARPWSIIYITREQIDSVVPTRRSHYPPSLEYHFRRWKKGNCCILICIQLVAQAH